MADSIKSPMSEEFHDWLDKCPVPWVRMNVFQHTVTYSFQIDECRACDGSGIVEGESFDDIQACTNCNGTGKIG